MRRLILNAALFGMCIAGSQIFTAPAASAQAIQPTLEGCTYADCMKYCTPEHGFDYCNTLCNGQCGAE